MKSKRLAILFVSICTIMLVVSLSLVATTAAAPATTTPGQAGEKTEIVLGAINSLTGVNVLTAQEQKWGQEQAVKDINAAGGVNVGGKMMTLRLVYEDDRSTPEGGAEAMEKLIKVDKVDLTLSSNITPINQAAATVAEKYGMYYAINTSWTDFIRAGNYNFTSDMFASTTSAAAGPFDVWSTMPENERPTKPAVLTEDNPDGQGFGEGFKAAAAKYGYTLAVYDSYVPGTKDYSSNILKLKAAGVDALLWLGSPPDGITLIQQIKAQNLNMKYIHGFKGFWDVQFPEALGDDSDYMIHDGFWAETLPYPGAKELGEKFKADHDGKDSVSVGLPYASVQVVKQAIEKAGSYESAKVRDAVFNGSFTGTVMGDVTFDADGISETPLLALQWMDGKRIPVWPDVGNTLLWMPPWNER